MATNEIFLHSCYGSFSVLVPIGASLVVEWGNGGGGVEHCVNKKGGWRSFYRNYHCDDSIYVDTYCTHVYVEGDAPILGFSYMQGCYPSYSEIAERVDTSHCPSLLELSCTVLKPLDLSGNPLLNKLNCDDSRFETLDLSHNPALEVLSCRSCRNLTKLNLSRNAALRELDIAFSGVKKLGLSNRSALQRVNYEYSHLDAKSEEYLLRIIGQNGGTVVKSYGWEDDE